LRSVPPLESFIEASKIFLETIFRKGPEFVSEERIFHHQIQRPVRLMRVDPDHDPHLEIETLKSVERVVVR